PSVYSVYFHDSDRPGFVGRFILLAVWVLLSGATLIDADTRRNRGRRLLLSLARNTCESSCRSPGSVHPSSQPVLLFPFCHVHDGCPILCCLDVVFALLRASV